jgi:hypothetical protein
MPTLDTLPPVVKLAVVGIALLAVACLILGLVTVGVVWFLRLVAAWLHGLFTRTAQARAEAAGACYHEDSGNNPLTRDSFHAA